MLCFFFSSRRRHTRSSTVSWGSEMCIRDSLLPLCFTGYFILTTWHVPFGFWTKAPALRRDFGAERPGLRYLLPGMQWVVLSNKIKNCGMIALVYQSFLGQAAFPLLVFLGKDVVLESVLTLDLAGAGQLEPFFRTGLRLHLWHYRGFLSWLAQTRRECSLLLFLRDQVHDHPLSFQLRHCFHNADIF